MIRDRSLIALFAGPLSALVLYLVLPTEIIDVHGERILLSRDIRVVISTTTCMAIWWISEVVPLAVTALLPLALFPLLDLLSFKETAQAYAHPLIFLFFGGFLVSIALQKWGVHRRFAVSLLRRVGQQPTHIIGGFMFVTAFLSMWLSNTATTIMILPIALSVIGVNPGNFAKCLLLSVAYSASIGGMATIIGTPPNLYVASYFSDAMGREIGFLDWMAFGLPCVALLLPAAWFFLTHVFFSFNGNSRDEIGTIDGPELVWRELDRGARYTLVIFGLLVFAWVTRPWINDLRFFGRQPFAHLTDAGSAILAACALFVVPLHSKQKRFVLDWGDVAELPWGTLILFGGGLSLAAAVNTTGADAVLGVCLSRLPLISPLVAVIAILALVIFLTELTSNIATTATLVPVLAAAAPLLGLDSQTTIVLVALAASCAFMLPVATPPNAVVFSSGILPAPQMAAAGLRMNIIALLIFSLLAYQIVPFVLH